MATKIPEVDSITLDSGDTLRTPNPEEFAKILAEQKRKLEASGRAGEILFGKGAFGDRRKPAGPFEVMRHTKKGGILAAKPRASGSEELAISAKELGLEGFTSDAGTEEGLLNLSPEGIRPITVMVKDPESNEYVKYRILAESKEQANEVLDMLGMERKGQMMFDSEIQTAKALAGEGFDAASRYLGLGVDALTDYIQASDTLATDGDILRQLSTVPGFLNKENDNPWAFAFGWDITQTKSLEAKAALMKEQIPGIITKIVVGKKGQLELFAKFGPEGRWAQIDNPGIPIGKGTLDGVLAELEGDAGQVAGHLLNATTTMIMLAAKKLPVWARGASGKAVASKLAEGVEGAIQNTGFHQYLLRATGTALDTKLGRWIYQGLGISGAAGIGHTIDQSIVKSRGFRHDEWQDIMDEAGIVFQDVFIMDRGLAIVTAGLSTFASQPMKLFYRTKEEHIIAAMAAAKEYHMPLMPPDLHPMFGSAWMQAENLSAAAAQFASHRDAFVLSGMKDGFIRRVLDGSKELAPEELAAIAGQYKKKMIAQLGDYGTELAGNRALRKHIYEYGIADKKGLMDLAVDTAPHVGKATFTMTKLQQIKAKAERLGVRHALEGTKFGKKGQAILPSGKIASISESTATLADPMSTEVEGLLSLVNTLETRMVHVPGKDFVGQTSTIVDQIIALRTRAFALADAPGQNMVSANAAAATFKEAKQMMLNPVNASKELKSKLKRMSEYMDDSEQLQSRMWVKRMFDPKYQPKYGDAYEIGVEFFNLQRPEVISEAKQMLTGQRNVPGSAVKWEEVRRGFAAKMINNPSDIPAIIANKENHEGLRLLFSKSELASWEGLAKDLAAFQQGPMARLMEHSTDVAEPLKAFWVSKNTDALRSFMKEAGGADSAGGRAVAGSFFSFLLRENSTMLKGMDVLNKTAMAKAMAELRTSGWLDILVGQERAVMLNAKGVETVLSIMVGGSNMGAGLITASVTQSAVGGVLAAPKKAVHGWRKWFSNYIGGRYLVSPSLFKTAKLPNPRYYGSVDGKHLIPPEMSYLRTFADMIAAAHAIAEKDANDLGLGEEFGAADLRNSMDGGSPKVNIRAEDTTQPPRSAATLPGTNALGLPNLQAAERRTAGPAPSIQAPQVGQQPRRAGGGMPTGDAAGVPPGPRPKLGPN